ncbi:MAG: orotate phosphoribosyltransferase [Deltaproteobacteria bacterium]|nr:orotate phosphoribosyltransferase [Deltaproteobacteria bacterium]
MEEELLGLIYEKGFQYNEAGEFILASGKKSKFYVDCRKVTSLAKAKYLMSRIIYEKIAELQVDAIGGPEVGAIPIADAVSYASYLEGDEVKSFWIRKQAKGHGLKKWIEGDVTNGDRVVIVDDVITTGKSTIEALRRAREAGLVVVKVIALVDREEENGKQNLEAEGVSVEALFTVSDLMKAHGKESANRHGL